MASLNHLTRKIFFIKLVLEYFLGIIGQWQATPRVRTKASVKDRPAFYHVSVISHERIYTDYEGAGDMPM